MTCPKCAAECIRYEVDIGFGTQFGPFNCPSCGWSEADEVDIFLKIAQQIASDDECDRSRGEREDTEVDRREL